MTNYEVGDLSKLFTQGFSKTETSKNKDEKGQKKKKGKKSLSVCDTEKGIQDKAEQAKKDEVKDHAVQKALKMKASIDKEKERQNQKEEQNLDSPNPAQSLTKEKKGTKGKQAKQGQPPSSKGEPSGEVKAKKGKKLKKKGGNNTIPGFSPPPGMVHESLLQKGKKRELDDTDKNDNDDNSSSAVNGPVKKKKKIEDDEEEEEMPKRKRKNAYITHTAEEDRRTIFIGNLSLQVKERDLLRMFKEFGKVQSIRRRCIPIKEPDQLKRVAAIKQEFHPERSNCICYIKYQTEESAKKALVNNGKLIEGKHIRVDIADGNVVKDTKRTVFVSNLPFDVEEEPVRAHFEDCGDIENVRLVRDRKTSLGKGIGYVKFSDPSAVFLAFKLNGSPFQKRALRVQKCQYNIPKPEKSINSGKPGGKKSKPTVTATNPTSFQGEKAKKVKKRNKQSNARSTTSSLFATKKTPVTVNKSFNTSTNSGMGSSNTTKHIRFDDKDKSGGKRFGKPGQRQNTGFKSNRESNFGNKANFSKKDNSFAGKQGGFQKGKPDFKKGVQINTGGQKRKHTHFD